MKGKALLKALVAAAIFLALFESMARLAPIVTPRAFRKPLSNGYGGADRADTQGNLSPLYRGQKIRLGVFTNSNGTGPVPQAKRWPALLQSRFRDLHVAQYMAIGATYLELKTLLNESIARHDRFDAVILNTHLSLFDMAEYFDPEAIFQYSYPWRKSEPAGSMAFLSLRKALEKSFPSIKPAASREPVNRKDRRWIRAESERATACFREKLSTCIDAYEEEIKHSSAATHQQKLKVYDTAYLGCRTNLDQKCGYERRPLGYGYNLAKLPNAKRKLMAQIQDLNALAAKLSDRVIFVIAPYATAPEIDPVNIVGMDEIILDDVDDKLVAKTDEDLRTFRRQSVRLLQTVLTESGVKVMDLHQIFSSEAVDQALFRGLGHINEAGHRIYADVLAAEFLTINFPLLADCSAQ